jgi:hypothetical protein
MRIDPDNLKTIFRASIEFETILGIISAFNNSKEKWLNTHSDYLISFLYNLTKVDRFSMAVEFCMEEEKKCAHELISKLKDI